ncbi:hypothetical protein FIBSPDRAFT_759195 [Athelia psychrophila]|uniref:Nudix hydrolase domain-containing protein n=1 Tax=Athelia psychrophila TaxID=1759441 RepID=A0A165YUV0_9AGAM|nr:hypothetical protein FIBSPDRAFT_759195 [Fibularhizoctonia sp. CBS 109695]
MPDSDSPGKPINLYKFHKPRLHLYETRPDALKAESKRCLRNLANYTTPHIRLPLPPARQAAVLVALFVGRHGDLYVLLNRRASTLRTYAGDTALPGGKVEPGDRTIEDTARREAFEEIGLPIDSRKVPLLCVLPPFLARNALIVTPVVVLVLDTSLHPILAPAEVASIFSHPLHAFLSNTSPFPNEPEAVEVEYHTSFDHPWDGPPPPAAFADFHFNHDVHKDCDRSQPRRMSRLHSFLTGREAGGTKPVFGLTAAMLIEVARIGYKREPEFEVQPPNAPNGEERAAWALRREGAFRRAYEEEGRWESVKAALDGLLIRIWREREEQSNAVQGRKVRRRSRL